MKITDIDATQVQEVPAALELQSYCQKAIDKVNLMTEAYKDTTTFIYLILEKGRSEKGEDPNLMYFSLSKEPEEPRVSLTRADADAMVMHLRDVYFQGVKDTALEKRNALIARANELANQPSE